MPTRRTSSSEWRTRYATIFAPAAFGTWGLTSFELPPNGRLRVAFLSLAQFTVDFGFVGAVATWPDDSRTFADECLVLLRPFHDLHVTGLSVILGHSRIKIGFGTDPCPLAGQVKKSCWRVDGTANVSRPLPACLAGEGVLSAMVQKPCNFSKRRCKRRNAYKTRSPARQAGGGPRNGFVFLFAYTRLFHLPGKRAGVKGPDNVNYRRIMNSRRERGSKPPTALRLPPAPRPPAAGQSPPRSSRRRLPTATPPRPGASGS